MSRFRADDLPVVSGFLFRGDFWAETKPDGSPNIAGMLRRAVYAIYLKHKAAPGMIPTNGRFIYYELEHEYPDLVKKDVEVKEGEKKPRTDQRANVALTELREAGVIPWEDILDETRELIEWDVFPSIEEAMRDRLENARLSLWHPQRPPLIICESRSLAGPLRNLAAEYQCPITSTNGQCAGHLHRLARWLKRRDRILLFGDLDRGGTSIERNNRKVLDGLVLDLIWERVAITEAQVKDKRLIPLERVDARDNVTSPAVECEALGQETINDLLRDRLEELMPAKSIERAARREKRERREWRRKHRL